ncbi:MAG: hypothetical protein LW625_09675 [Planctomycetaceae bacterium]|nr:hypothetical protein [Planctomycetaceae bacterium]
MAQPHDNPASTLWRQPLWLAALALLIGAAIAARAWINFGSAVPPGMDAGYYAVQARSLLEHGRLQWSDVPLVFALDAALAKTAMVTCGWSVDQATMWSTRVVDSVAQPLVACVIFAATFVWSGGRRGALLAAIAAATMATLSAPILRMTGDFEKQSMAMVFMAGAWMATARALASITRGEALRRGAVALALLALTALSHAGTFGAAALGVALTMMAWAMRGGVSRVQLVRATVAALVLGVLMLGAVWLLAPTKANALMQAPMKLFGSGGPGGGMGAMPPMPGGMGGPGGMRGRGGPPGLAHLGTIAWFAGLIVMGFALRWAIRQSRVGSGNTRTTRADVALAIGLTLTAAFLTLPLLNPDYGMRLSIMAPVPLALVLAYLLSMRGAAGTAVRGWRAAILPALCGVVFVASIASGAIVGRGPMGMQLVSADSLSELRGWRDEVNTGGPIVVAARHGVEFWAAFGFDCDARLERLKATDFDRYRRLYVLVQKRGGGMRGPPGMGGPMTRVPDGATVVKDGEWFTLYEVPASARAQIEAEANQTQQATSPRGRNGRRPQR